MKNIVAGILAHVDSGKTTLSEAMLYQAGQIRKLGRVDHQDTYLDTDSQEKDRGITIFSKQAELALSLIHIFTGITTRTTCSRQWRWRESHLYFVP